MAARGTNVADVINLSVYLFQVKWQTVLNEAGKYDVHLFSCADIHLKYSDFYKTTISLKIIKFVFYAFFLCLTVTVVRQWLHSLARYLPLETQTDLASVKVAYLQGAEVRF